MDKSPFERDPHYLLAPNDVPTHLVEHHGTQGDITALVEAVTKLELAKYRSRVEPASDEIDRAQIIHDRLHDLHGEDH